MHRPNHPTTRLLPYTLLTLALALTACSSSNSGSQTTEAMRKLAKTYPGHNLFIPEDAAMVLRFNAVGDRFERVTQSKAFAKLTEFVARNSKDDPEVEPMLRALRSADPGLLTTLNQTTSIIFYEDPTAHSTPDPAKTPAVRTISDVSQPQTNSDDDLAFAIVITGDAAQTVKDLVQSFEPERADKLLDTELSDNMRVLSFPESSSKFYVSQAGPIGVIAPNEAMLRKTISMRSNSSIQRLSQSKTYNRLLQNLPKNPDVFVYLRDWTDSTTTWSDMVRQDPNKKPSMAAGALSLQNGIDLQFTFQTNEESFDDPSTKAFLKNLAEAGAPPTSTIQNILPSNTLVYFNLNVPQNTLKKTLAQSTLDGATSPQANSILQPILETISGEFAFVVTSNPGGQAKTRMGMYALPEAALIARLSSPDKEPELAKTLANFSTLFAQDAPPQPGAQGAPLGNRRTAQIGPHQAVLFSTEIPGLNVGYLFHKGHLILGTENALRHIAERPASVPLLGNVQLNPIVSKSFQTPSHYTLHTDLLATYEFVKTNYAPFLAILGVDPGSPDDPVLTLVSVTRFLGGNITFTGDLMNVRMHLTVQDLP